MVTSHKLLGSLTLLVVVVQCLAVKKWSGSDNGHGHGWTKLHSNRHHDASSKLSEAYVKFHKLGDGSTKGGNMNQGGKFAALTSIFNKGQGSMSESDQGSSSGWAAPMTLVPVQMMMGGGGWGQEEMMSKGGGGGGGGWGGGQMMMESASGWGSMGGGGGSGGAKPTGWASPGGGMMGMQMQMMQMQEPTGWATGSFAKFKPGAGGGNNKGHFNFELPSGKPAYIQKLKPLIDLPKLSLKGWGW